MSDAWNPGQYHRFGEERERPARDLLALIHPAPAGRGVDLGCGSGELTVALRDRAGLASVVGYDTSPAMLAEAARLEVEGVRFETGDLATWQAQEPLDVVFANASLHWVPDHAGVIARWTESLLPGGQIAIQVPANHRHPSHLVADEVGDDPRFAAAFAGNPPPDPVAANVLAPRQYAELLHDLGYVDPTVRLQVYGPVLERSADVVEWMRGTSLNRFAAVLEPAVFAELVEEYRRRFVAAVGDRSPYYFAFDRILIHARRPSV